MQLIEDNINNNKSITLIGIVIYLYLICLKYNIPLIELDKYIEKKYNNILPEIIIYGEREEFL